MEPAINLVGIGMSYGDTVVLQDINLSVATGEVLAIIGPSGSGKSTLLRMVIGLARPTTGEIYIDGERVDNYNEANWHSVREKMGMVFQYSALFDSMTVADNVAFGLRLHTEKTEEEIAAIVNKMLELVGLTGYNDYMPVELSGGMKKRVSLARAIATDPSILLYDEPTAGLDPVMSDVINNLMLETKNRMKVTSILVTHDMYSAFVVADRIAMIHEGRIIADGPPSEIIKSTHPVVEKFIKKALPPGGIFDEQ